MDVTPGEAVDGDAADEAGGGPTLLLDDLGTRLTDFYSLRKTNSDDADNVLDQLGANDTVDREIVLELAAPKPLWRPDRFLEAHTLMVRSLEVLDRNGTRSPPVPKVGPLRPILKYLTEIAAKFIVRSHVRGISDSVYRLYARREANCTPAYDDHRRLLRRGRVDMERVMPGFKRNPLAIPGVLLGGAFLTTILSVVQDTIGLFGGSGIAQIIATSLVFLLAVLGAFVILQGAAVAHRRIDMTTDQPLAALYDVIGRAGNPPNDQSGTFAIIALILMALAILVIPVGAAITISI
ncbi:MAG: hypothetical protein HKN26_01115 [Acidimicrobiales bacterium]|nr:hypothetical protein [Acidimicrobiales bacterium]